MTDAREEPVPELAGPGTQSPVIPPGGEECVAEVCGRAVPAEHNPLQCCPVRDRAIA